MKKFRNLPKKEKTKIIRSIFEAIVLIILLVVMLRAIFTFNEYTPFTTESLSENDSGFIALSYFGVDREGSDTLISTDQLESHIAALKSNGYVTITQEDIINYYQHGQKLPDRALFLMFEDGRRDTVIFSEKILDRYNFIATTLTYANKLELKDPKFLSGDDLVSLKENSYWELGTNGYRLSYINAFDRYDKYIGELNTLEYASVSQYLDRNYNHYLMDFMRDENDIPVESFSEMKARIEFDYQMMADIYAESTDEMPRLYAIMHANTGQFASNDTVSRINEALIYDYFDLNFNREGYVLNNRESSIYDLTRMQPQPYWSDNHLLMRIKSDTGKPVEFEVGDTDKADQWVLKEGAAEFKAGEIILTSEPEGRGILFLDEFSDLADLKIEAELLGNKMGTQKIYLRANSELTTYIAITLMNKQLTISESINGKEIILNTIDLDTFDGIIPASTEEDALNSQKTVLETRIKYSDNDTVVTNSKEELETLEALEAESVLDGREAYIPEIELKDSGRRALTIELTQDQLTVFIDNKKAGENLLVSQLENGSVAIEAAWAEYGYSQRNLIDDVYDGVFSNVNVHIIHAYEPNIETIYQGELTGFKKLTLEISQFWNTIVNWFINNL